MAKRDTRTAGRATQGHQGGRLSKTEIPDHFPAARRGAMEQVENGFRAKDARYSAAAHALMITLANGTTIGIRVDTVAALRAASPRALSTVELTPTGSGLHWGKLDVDLSVPALIREALGEESLRTLFGGDGGRTTGEPQSLAVRRSEANGGQLPKPATDIDVGAAPTIDGRGSGTFSPLQEVGFRAVRAKNTTRKQRHAP